MSSVNENGKNVKSNDEEIDLGDDLGNIKGGQDLPEPGRYLLKVESFEKRERKDGGEAFLNGQFRIMDCETDATEAQVHSVNRVIFDAFNLKVRTDPATGKEKDPRWKIKALLAACFPGYEGRTVPKDIVGKFFSAYVYIDTYNNNENARFKNPKKAEGWSGQHYQVGENQKLTLIDSGTDVGKDKPGKGAGTKAATKSATKSVTKGEKKPENEEEVDV